MPPSLSETETVLIFSQWLEATPDILVITGLESEQLLFVNDAFVELTGYGRGEAIGRTLHELDLYVRPSQAISVHERARLRESSSFRWELRTKSGQVRVLETSARAVTLGDRDYIVAMSRDGSERARNEQTASRLAAIVESSDEAIFGQNLDGVITSWNSGAERMYGYPADEAKGRTDSSLLIPADIPDDSTPSLKAIARGETVHRYETVRERKDGTMIPVSLTVSAVPDDAGEIVGASVIARDITARKQTERELQESEAKYRAVVEHVPAVVYSWTAAEGLLKVVEDYVSPQIEAVLGYNPADWMANPDLWFDRLHEEDRKDVIAEVARCVQSGEPFRMEYRMVARDGRIVWLHDEAAVVSRDDPRGVVRYQGVQLDVTARKDMESTLRESDARKSAIFAAAMDCIISIDGEGRILEFNPAAERTFGYSTEEATGAELADLIIAPRYKEAHRAGLARYVATGEGSIIGQRLEFTALHRDGTEFPVELTVTSVSALGHTIFTGFIRDISARKRSEDDLTRNIHWLGQSLVELREVHADRQKLLSSLLTAREDERRRIASDIHDDAVQKVTAATIRLDMLARNHPHLATDEGFTKVQESLRRSLESMRHLMFELRLDVLDTDGLVAALRMLLQEEPGLPNSPTHRIHGWLAAEPPEDIGIVLYRVAQEALANVRKHANASTVDVSIRDQRGGYAIQIKDDGVGFDTSGIGRSEPGHLGLVSMRERVEMKGGSLLITSHLGKGTMVEFWLPGPQGKGSDADQDEPPAKPR
jgi:PAS domain S-box-containing protein